MWLISSLIISVLSLVQGNNIANSEYDYGNYTLKLPETYSFAATKIDLLGGETEYIQAWRTPTKSRTDRNKGIDTTIIYKTRRGIKYEIHPESDDNENSEIVCTKTIGNIFYPETLDDFLPDSDDFEAIGTEVLHNVEYIKFYKKESSDGESISESTLWAYKDSNDESTWLLARYESKTTNSLLGMLTNYEIWEYSNFDASADDEIFSIDQYDCDLSKRSVIDHEQGTENMHFLNPDNDEHIEHAFTTFKKKFNRRYDDDEHEMRKNIFRNNMRLISQSNSKNLGYKLAINRFADRTKAEMTKHKGLLRRPKGETGIMAFPYTEKVLGSLVKSLPKQYDARLYGLVTPVKQQETCGSCWTFGTTAAVEGALARRIGRLVTLSNQAILDCSWALGNSGCNGGFDIRAYEWILEHGLPTEAEYGPYLDSDDYCRINNMTAIYGILGYVNVTPNSVNALKVALLYHGPLSVSINADPDGISFYSSGIFYDADCSGDPRSLDHEVTLVGYGEKDGETFWIIKNSWGKEWGMDGYMHISAKDNNCGITTEPTYVVV